MLKVKNQYFVCTNATIAAAITFHCGRKVSVNLSKSKTEIFFMYSFPIF